MTRVTTEVAKSQSRPTRAFDALVIGYYDGGKLIYAARTRNGFTLVVRAQLMKRFRPLEIKTCPFVNLHETKSGRWGAGLTKAKMADCRWLRPTLVGQFEFLEWTGKNHLRHSRFIALRDAVRRSRDRCPSPAASLALTTFAPAAVVKTRE